MIAPNQLKKPSNWQDFEKLCKLLWGEIWNCSDSIKRHGRQGQNQHGVDIYAYVDKYGGYCGIQCKGKDEYTNAQLTVEEIDSEIKKAKTFEPALSLLVFATTANKDAKIEGYIRKKDVENRKQNLFKVDIASWEDIVDHLEQYRDTYNWYVNNCQFKDSTDVSVTFDGKEEITIYPEYFRTTTHYEFKQLSQEEKDFQKLLSEVPPLSAFLNRPQKVDKRWCKLHIYIENTGSTVIKSPKLIVFFRSDDIEKLDDGFYYCNTFGIDNAARAQINASKDAKREVFQTYRNEIEYKPKESVFVQKDNRDFTIDIIVSNDITELSLFWTFLCEDYQKEGILTINVEPVIDDRVKTIEVENESDVKPDEVTIDPKVI
ncbi:MAG: hypothetical protein LKI18_07555 [Prevotella sp.]|jgi:hypothetical protein|nr:hypothetical protein [Prevotella sp.]